MEETARDAADRLEARLAAARAQRAALLRSTESLRAARGLSVDDDEHDPEGSTLSLDHAQQRALLGSAERTVAELVAARQRLVEGTYGRCEACGGAIPAGRLVALPEARRCVPCLTVRAAR